MTLGKHGALAVRWSAAMLAAGLLAGCGTGETGLQRDAAKQLQARVLEVTQASSQNDPATALRALESLEAELESAQSKGGISDERRRSITTIAAAVRADLTDAIAKTEQAKARAEEEARQAAEQAAQQTPPAQEAPAPSTVQPSGENAGKKDNQGKGKGSG
ncbi:hypothetical protein [Pseudarthrobacter chlorophenolicus]|uniref:hypothetical protein n=1 Tax=Pseudarthrobacter chlorophenolicus TaxID=85085 RepID=UPI0006981F21|nr:hypothetical protein [Pseudarthrobacter chlorophenolicus]